MDDSSGIGRWLTYDELAALRGIKRIGAVRLVQRHKWRRQAGNDGLARVLVPPDALEPVRGTDAGSSASTKDARISADDTPHTTAGTDAGNVAVQFAAQLDQANQRVNEANRRADAAVALADRTLTQLAEATTRAERAEQAVAGERSRADALRDRLEAVQAEASEAQQRAREEAEAGEAELRVDLDQARAEAQEATQAAEELRRADADRKARGRWARLRAAWRGN